jgi:hypothetical protein
MSADHPKFCVGLQTISVKHMHVCLFWRLGSELNSKFSGQKPPRQPISAAAKLFKRPGGFANRPLDPAIPVRRRVPF